jgi:hypothetical protein
MRRLFHASLSKRNLIEQNFRLEKFNEKCGKYKMFNKIAIGKIQFYKLTMNFMKIIRKSVHETQKCHHESFKQTRNKKVFFLFNLVKIYSKKFIYFFGGKVWN